ncbi:hypothetical protein [Prosthecobacter sp.]|uniref:hypothetical protein n=1 Tax=Prosthecobacter sp. TaxID=1965333 RepID=UPI002ABC6473|nr:hypothetical protein [Prosthecobacter sp.]MDZ4401619.1 hypothetical protein [Prosthecobacter sp.]
MKPRQRNRYRNSLGLPTITAILIVVASLALVGLGIVVSKNRVRALGEEQRKVESDMRLLQAEILALNNRIETLLTRDRVQPRLTGAGTLLRQITKRSLIMLKPLPPQPVEETASAPSLDPSFAQTTPQNP